MKKRILIGILIFILCSTYIYSMNKVKNSVNDFLMNNKGYNKNEYSLNVSYMPLNYLLNNSPYNIEDIFNDEPNVTYDYRYYKNGEVI